MADGNIKFNAGINTGGFKAGAAEMSRTAEQTSAAVKSAFAKIAVATAAIGAAVMAARSAFGAFDAAIEAGGALNDLSSRTGETAGNLMVLQRAFKNAGAGADAVGPTIDKLRKALSEAGNGGKEAQENFARLGLDFAAVSRMAPTDALRAVATALQRVPGDTERSALAMALFGRSGGELLPLLRALGSELETARNQLGSAPAIMDKTNAALDTIGDSMAAIGEKGKEFALGVMSKVAPALASITASIAEIDAAGLGVVVSRYIRDFGQWAAAAMGVGTSLDNIKLALKGIQEGNFGDSIKALVLIGRDLAMSTINEVARVGVSAVAAMGETFAYIFREGGPMVTAAEAFFNYFEERIRLIGAGLLAKVAEAMPGGVVQGLFFKQVAGDKSEALSALGASVGAAGSDIYSESSMFSRRFSRNMAATGDVFDMTGRREQTAAAAQKASMTTLEGLRAQFDDLMREPRNAMRDAEEAKLIDRIREMTRSAATPQAMREAEAGRTSAQREDTASESTLREIAKTMADLNSKLPMPALV